MQIKTAENGQKKIVMSRKEWDAIGKRAGWKWTGPPVSKLDENSTSSLKIDEGTRFFDPRVNQKGTLVIRTYHRTNLWMMLYDSGEIQELTLGDLKAIQEI